jgi:hypothetical protein
MSTCTVALLQVSVAGLDWAANLNNKRPFTPRKPDRPKGRASPSRWAGMETSRHVDRTKGTLTLPTGFTLVATMNVLVYRG